MPMIAGIASAGAGILGGVIGGLASQGDRDRATAMMQDAMNELKNVKIPDIEKQKIVLKKLTQQGIITPEKEQEILQDQSSFEKIQEDKQLRDTQVNSLNALKKIANLGLTPEQRADLNDMRSKLERDIQARDQSIIQNMQQRGQAGSGSELAQRLLSSQQQSENAASAGDRLAAMAYQNQLNAIRQSGSLAGDIRNQDFGVEAAKASAADKISQFNTQNRIGVQERNVNASNQAQQKNLGEKQRIADTNVGLENTEETHNKSLYQQQYENELRRAQAIANAASGVAGQYNKNAEATSEMWSNIGGGAAKGIGALGQK